MKYYNEVASPIGIIGIVTDEEVVIAVAFHPDRDYVLKKLSLTGREKSSQIGLVAVRQIEEYFSGNRTFFELPINFARKTAFSAAVLERLAEVPFGEILTYGELAALAGHPQAARAVGRVMGANPVPLIVPCHRVVGSSGKMTGYSGGEGLPTKEWLLAFETDRLVN